MTSNIWFGCADQQAGKDSSSDQPQETNAVVAGEMTYAGKTYPTIQVNDRIWLAKNLDVAVDASWCYQNDQERCIQSGRLYRMGAAREACSLLGERWRLPSRDEWVALLTHYGGYFDYMSDEELGNARQANRTMTEQPFYATLGGWRGSNGGYDNQGQRGFYWSSDQKDDIQAWCVLFYPSGGRVTLRPAATTMGMSCRCVRDLK